MITSSVEQNGNKLRKEENIYKWKKKERKIP
jgi:hypothetical protein